VVVVLRGDLGVGFLLASMAFFRSSAAVCSLASFSSGGGIFSLMFNLRTPAVKLSISSPLCRESATVAGAEDVGFGFAYDGGIFGTGGAFLGLMDRFGVDARDPLETLAFFTRTLSEGFGPEDVEGLEHVLVGVCLPASFRFSSGSERIVEATLCLRLSFGITSVEDASRVGSGKSLIEAIVVRRLLRPDVLRGVGCTGTAGDGGAFIFLSRSCIRLSAGVRGVSGVSVGKNRSLRAREASAFSSSGRQLVVVRSVGIRALKSSWDAVAQSTWGNGTKRSSESK
jgi:hypothetical protein